MPRIHNSQSASTSALDQSRKRRTLDWRPRTPEEIARKKSHKVINQYLKRIGKAAGRELSLDHNGVCCFTFKKFVLCVEVPEDNSSICLFSSLVCNLEAHDNLHEVQKFVNIYNHRQSGSSQELDASDSSSSTVASRDPLEVLASNHGIRLGIKEDTEDEVNLCLAFPIKGLKYHAMAEKLEYFVKNAVAVNRKLEHAKSIPPPLPEPATLEEEAPPSPGSRRCRIWSTDSQNSVSNMSQCSIFNLFASATGAHHE